MAQVNNICNNIDTPLVYLLTDNCNTILLIINCAVNTFSRIALLKFIFVIIIAFCFVVCIIFLCTMTMHYDDIIESILYLNVVTQK